MSDSKIDSGSGSEKLDHFSQQVSKKEHVFPFSDSVKQTLLTLYHRGMTGWGTKKSHLIAIAEERTGLKSEQIKVKLIVFYLIVIGVTLFSR